jgi:hypothetical protein
VKQTKKPTRDNKRLMSKCKLNPDEWRVISDTKTELVIINESGERRTLSKVV